MARGKDGGKRVFLDATSPILSWKEVGATMEAGRAAWPVWVKGDWKLKPFHACLFYDPRGLGFTQIEQHVE